MLFATLPSLLLAAATGALATQTFSNTGQKSGWDQVYTENKGTVEDITNIPYKGATALKMTQTWDPNWSGRFHSEVFHYNAYKKGDTGFYGFAFRLQESWEFNPQSYNLAQFITDFSDLNCGEDSMPSSMVFIEGDQIGTRVKYGNVCPTQDQKTTYFRGLKTVTPGVWHKVVIQASWRSDSTGFYKMWYDGEKVTENYNLATTVTDGRAFQFRVGLYANSWHDDPEGYTGNQPFRQVWFDQIGIGSEFKDADPDQW
ncbi:putative glucuronan lyase a protein [Eutypa lata UCREL1]|uniref:Putative glucuronan lyase a protein n=1 Tax=Eutypa lata (strain UCR-EL1) TaxID=1287681 RepID=M7SBD2_EUTLA|nr:putative glucuronan lyase a protein [Eutypa lata UCREL1]